MWTKDRLNKLVTDKIGDYKFILVSNREPYEHFFNKGKIDFKKGTGGLITALDPVMQACNGTWFAFGRADADYKVTDDKNFVKVPPDEPLYNLKRIKLTKEEDIGYYYGYSNEALWPLSHSVFNRPIFRSEDWKLYEQVNKKIASAIMEEVGNKKAFVWIQDYHFCLLPKYLREMSQNNLTIAQFWHIPWPSYETFRICPQKKDILEGMLANDLMGFQIQYHSNNFLDVLSREIEGKVNNENFSFEKGDHETFIRSYPISIDYEHINEISKSDTAKAETQALAEEFGLFDKKVIASIDRIDYTKGLPEKILAIDMLLEKHPELKGKIVFLQSGETSRILIQKYKAINDEINSLVEEINWKYSTDGWKPIIFVKQHLSFKQLLAYYLICDVFVVSSLHDGMNLVAKEFISTRYDEEGMLVLSKFAGAASEFTDSVTINPFDREEFSEGLYNALTMPKEEKTKRMIKMRLIAQENNIFRWAGKILSDLFKLDVN